MARIQLPKELRGKDYLTANEVAGYLNVNPATVRKWAGMSGRRALPAVRIAGKALRIPADRFKDWCAVNFERL